MNKEEKDTKQIKKNELEQSKQYHNKHKQSISAYMKQYSIENNEKLKQYKQNYYSKMHGRSRRLVNAYKRTDKLHNRGECTLTPQWIIDNIFSKPCHYCGESDWHKLGCDRIDNSKPHTEDNVVPCCTECNTKRGKMNYDDYIKKILGVIS